MESRLIFWFLNGEAEMGNRSLWEGKMMILECSSSIWEAGRVCKWKCPKWSGYPGLELKREFWGGDRVGRKHFAYDPHLQNGS